MSRLTSSASLPYPTLLRTAQPFSPCPVQGLATHSAGYAAGFGYEMVNGVMWPTTTGDPGHLVSAWLFLRLQRAGIPVLAHTLEFACARCCAMAAASSMHGP